MGPLWPFQAVFPQRRAPNRSPDCGNSRWCLGPDGPVRPRQATSSHCLSPQKPASSCQTCFSVCFLFFVFNVARGMFPPPLPPTHPHFLPFFLPPNVVLLPLSLSLQLSLFLLKIVICKDLERQAGTIFVVVLWHVSLSLIFFNLLYEVLAQADTKKSAHTQKQQNVSPQESCRSHAKPIFFSRLNKLQRQKGRRK